MKCLFQFYVFPCRRFLGQKKDNFFIGKRSASAKEVLELLSSAGVLTSNPYHFVRQGEINSLAEATPAQRLKLLEDFAGTTVHKVQPNLDNFTFRNKCFFAFVCY